MTLFWIISASLILVTALVTVLPLLRKNHKTLSEDESNISIYQSQQRELEQDKANALIDEAAYLEAQNEIDHALLDVFDDEQEDDNKPNPHEDKKWRLSLIVLLIVFIPATSLLLYARWGEPDGLDNYLTIKNSQALFADATDAGLPTGEKIQKLRQKLESNPDNAYGWFLLARNLVSVGEYALSLPAFEKALSLTKNDVFIGAEYAQAIYMTDQALSPRFKEAASTLLAKRPDHPMILSIYGIDAFNNDNYAEAIEHWERTLTMLPEGDTQVATLQQAIAKARQLSGQARKPLDSQPETGKPATAALDTPPGYSKQPVANTDRLMVTVAIKDELKQRLDNGDVLFVFARAVNGPRVPLAIFRQSVSEFPLTIELNDSMSMAPKFKLSQYDKVIVGARVSKSGQALATPGDLQGYSGVIDRSSNGLDASVTIDHEVNG